MVGALSVAAPFFSVRPQTSARLKHVRHPPKRLIAVGVFAKKSRLVQPPEPTAQPTKRHNEVGTRVDATVRVGADVAERAARVAAAQSDKRRVYVSVAFAIYIRRAVVCAEFVGAPRFGLCVGLEV